MEKATCALIVITTGFFVSFIGIPYAQADSYENVFLDGVTWRVPKQFIDSQDSRTAGYNSISLHYELPDFTPVNPKDFSGVYPGDDLPILTAKISDDPKIAFGKSLLTRYVDEAMNDCSSCGVDYSSVGGPEYATFSSFAGPPPYSPDGVLFRLYEYPESDGLFALCPFASNGATLPCEMTTQLNPQTTVSVTFPIEYVTQGPELEQRLAVRLATYQQQPKVRNSPGAKKAASDSTCWAPIPGSPGSKVIPIQIGPEVWRIPEAYASTFGQNQTQDLRYDSITLWLKLPNLKPLSSRDPSPIQIRGQGDYINLLMEFDPRSWSNKNEQDMFIQSTKQMNYVGENAFVNYREYQDALKPGFLHLYSFGLEFKSNDPNSNGSLFPPDWFGCIQAAGAPFPSCNMAVNISLVANHNLANAGHYLIEYYFSRDYLSQISVINKCVESLYRQFRFGDTVK